MAINGPTNLSTIQDPQNALQELATRMVQYRIGLGNVANTRIAVEGNSNLALWNVLLAYLEGENVSWVKQTPRPALSEPDLSTQNLLDMVNFIEQILPINPDSNVGPSHPYSILQNIKNHIQNGKGKPLPAPIKAQVSDLIASLIAEVNLVERQYQGIQNIQQYENYRYQGINNGTVSFVNNNGQTVSVSPRLFLQEQRGQITINNLQAAPVILPEDLQAQQAKQFHDMMVRAANYRDKVEQSIKQFTQVGSVQGDMLFAKLSQNRPNIPDPNRLKVTVVGLGPAGIFAAIRAYQQGAKVTAIEARTEYTRNNVFRLTPEICDEIIKLFVDREEDIQNLPNNHPLKVIIDSQSLSKKLSAPQAPGSFSGDFYTISTKDFEYLTETIVELIAQRDPQGMQIKKGYGYIPHPDTPDPKTVYCRPFKKGDTTPLATDEKIPTDLLVAADGLNSVCRTAYGVGLDKMSQPVPYTTFTYHTPKGDEDQFFASLIEQLANPSPSFDPNFDINSLRAFDWTSDKLPVSRYFNTGEHPYLGIEVSPVFAEKLNQMGQEIEMAKRNGDNKLAYQLTERRDHLLDSWGRATLSAFLPPETINQLVIKRHAMFNTQLQRAKSSVVISTHQPHLAIIGDALQSAHFQTGMGAITGLLEGNDIGTLVKEVTTGGKNLETALRDFEWAAQKKSYALHDRAFNFFSGEDLKTKPTGEFQQFRSETRLGIINKDDPRLVKAETPSEASAKVNANQKRKKR